MIYDQNHAGIELPLRMVHIRLAWPFLRDHILDSDLRSLRLEHSAVVGIFAKRDEILE